ncbi:hypothetical protein EXU57_09255 [Segetibacter sp. 3557_3]|uniref:hypothetical protein n=1 Tax=Segetibacter sp. 3557_3 TaxID=2547429 RepID=UPI001058AF41|nr:hypothetical protein [Segetibacter sp. 3557_3]TDH26981.1 hypothetical protein EXU57_09255 [Segetibacter sp. 3557_3]
MLTLKEIDNALYILELRTTLLERALEAGSDSKTQDEQIAATRLAYHRLKLAEQRFKTLMRRYLCQDIGVGTQR